MKRTALPIVSVLLMLSMAGCQAPAIRQWEAAMIAYTEVVNQVADAQDAGKVSAEHVAEFREAMRQVRAALNAWRDTISSDGGTQSEPLRDFAMRVLKTFQQQYGRAVR